MNGDLPDLPDTWQWSHVSKFGFVKGGKRLPKGELLVEEKTGHPYLRIRDLKDGTVDRSQILYVPSHVFPEIQNYTIQHGDVYLTIVGSIGEAGTIPADFDGASLTENAAKIVQPVGLIPEFLAAWFRSPLCQRVIQQNIHSGGQGKLALFRIELMPVPLAPLAEQQRIVAKLEKLLGQVDACRQRLDKIPTLLKRFRQSVLAAACSGHLTEDWREGSKSDDTAGEFLSEIQHNRIQRETVATGKAATVKVYVFDPEDASSLPIIPDTWTWCSVSACADVRDGTHDSPKYHEVGVPLVTSKNLLPSGIDFTNVNLISHGDYEAIAKRSAVCDGDILFAMIGTIGNATIVNGGHPFAIKNVGLFRTFGSLVLSNYLRFWLNSPAAALFFRDHAKGSSQPFAPLNLLRALPFPLPPRTECEEIVRRVESLFALADNIEHRYKKAQTFIDKLTSSLLAKAFRGELVPQDPKDEPASVLLERIKAEREKENKVRKKGSRRH